MPPKGIHLVWEASNDEDPIKGARAIRSCLVYLADEANKLDLDFTAHLIGVAAESIEADDGNPSER